MTDHSIKLAPLLIHQTDTHAIKTWMLVPQYFGNVVASSSRTPPAQRVQAALAGGLFRSAAAALNPGQVCRSSRHIARPLS